VTTAAVTFEGGRRHRPWAKRQLGARLDLFRIGLFALTVLSVGRIHQHFSVLALFRPGLLILLALVAMVILNPGTVDWKGVTRSWRAWVTIGLLGVALAGMPFGVSFGATATLIINEYWKVIVTAVMYMLGLRYADDLRRMAWAFVVSTAFLSYFAFFVFQMSTAGSKAMRLGEGYMYDANDLGLVFIVGLPMTLWIALTTKGWRRHVVLGIAIAMIGGVARTGSRGAFIGLGVLAIAYVFLYPGGLVLKRLAVVVAAAVSLSYFAPPGYWDQMRTMLKPSEDYNVAGDEGRVAIAKRGIGYMMQYPVFGLGLGNFGRAECMFGPKVKYTPTGVGIMCTAPHNSWVQAGAETGFVGLSLYAAMTVGGMIGMFRLRNRLPRRWQRADDDRRFVYIGTTMVGFASIGYLVTSSFLSFAWMDMPYLLAALQGGLYFASRPLLAEDESVAGAVEGDDA
jgi:hypothetical protein